MITFIVCSHDEDLDMIGCLKDPYLLEICSKANYSIRVMPQPSDTFFRKMIVAPLLENGYIRENEWNVEHTYKDDNVGFTYKFVNEIKSELKNE